MERSINPLSEGDRFLGRKEKPWAKPLATGSPSSKKKKKERDGQSIRGRRTRGSVKRSRSEGQGGEKFSSKVHGQGEKEALCLPQGKKKRSKETTNDHKRKSEDKEKKGAFLFIAGKGGLFPAGKKVI